MADNCNFPGPDSRIKEAVCIDTKRIYDSCVSKDCLEDLRVTFFSQDQAVIDAAQYIKCRECEVETVQIDLDEVPFNHGFYSVDVTYYFKLKFDTFASPCANPVVTVGYAVFSKKCILYGGDGNVKTFSSGFVSGEFDCQEIVEHTNPSAKIQIVDPVVLSTKVVPNNECVIPMETLLPNVILEQHEGDTILPDDAEKAVFVTLGIFSILQINRDVQMLIPAYDFCIPDRECNCDNENPCDTFSRIDFPIDEFFPKDREDVSTGCGCSTED